ncbi:MAG TPA: hypothetical protein VK688_02860 [Gemmatimonadales bacterium]|nr:hypothetical protein [Gemmatimonadales bacterium]
MRWHQIAKAARRALADLVMGGRGRLARSSDAGVYSGWIGPDGRIEAAPGTAIHVTLLARFGEVTKEAFFAKGAVRYVDATDHVSLELMSQHPVALGNAIEALTRRWAHLADVDVEFLAPPEVLRASSAEVRQALGRRLRALEESTGPARPINSAATVRAFQQAIVTLAQSKLGRPLTAKEHAFITARGGFLALEAIHDTVTAASAAKLEDYLNSE